MKKLYEELVRQLKLLLKNPTSKTALTTILNDQKSLNLGVALNAESQKTFSLFCQTDPEALRLMIRLDVYLRTWASDLMQWPEVIINLAATLTTTQDQYEILSEQDAQEEPHLQFTNRAFTAKMAYAILDAKPIYTVYLLISLASPMIDMPDDAQPKIGFLKD